MTRILRISSSPAEPSIRNVLPSAGVSESDSDVRLGLGRDGGDVRVAALEKVEAGLHLRDDFCPHCNRVCTFEEIFRFDFWRMWICLGCDGEKFIPWTRTNSEAA